MFSLTKSFLKGSRIMVSESYVTNTHWLVRKDALEPDTRARMSTVATAQAYCPKTASVGTILESACNAIKPDYKSGVREYRRTNIMRATEQGYDIVLYQAVSGHGVCWIRRDYADQFGLDSLWTAFTGFRNGAVQGPGEKPKNRDHQVTNVLSNGATPDAWTVLIMPVRGDSLPELLASMAPNLPTVEALKQAG